MRLLQILYPGLGGHASVAKSLVLGDKDHKSEHHLLGFGIEEPTPELMNSNLWKITYVIKQKGIALSSYRSVYKEIKDINPDAIIAHSTSQVITVFIYSIFHQVKWLSVEHQSNHAKTKIDWIYSIIILLLSPKIVYLTEMYSQQISKKFKWIYSKKKVSVISNGIDTEIFHKNKSVKQNSPLILSMISRLNNLRDHITLIDAFKEISADKNMLLKIAGDGETFEQIKNHVHHLGLSSKIHLLGMLTEDQIISLLQETDIYIHSSLAETQSTSIMQAMSTKLPIIATDINGINNMIEHGLNGLLFEPFNKIQLISHMNLLLSNKTLRGKISRNAEIYALNNFSNTKMFNNYKQTLINENSSCNQ